MYSLKKIVCSLLFIIFTFFLPLASSSQTVQSDAASQTPPPALHVPANIKTLKASTLVTSVAPKNAVSGSDPAKDQVIAELKSAINAKDYSAYISALQGGQSAQSTAVISAATASSQPVALLTIFADGSTFSSGGSLSGHAFMTVTNISSS